MSDLVARLRRLSFHAKHLADNENLHALYVDAFQRCEQNEFEAANEIERLTAEHDALRRTLALIMEGLEGTCMTCVPIGVRNQQLQQDIKTLQSMDETMKLRQQVAELRAERDALRRTLARMYMDPNAFATAKGWDCFERETE